MPITGAWIPQTEHNVIILRILRLQRALHLVKIWPELLVIINALIESTYSVGYLALILSLFFYVYAILGVTFW